MEYNLEMRITKLLRKKNYLRKNDKFMFKICEEVQIAAYNMDLYLCEQMQTEQKIKIYWGDIKRRNKYYEVYVSVISENRIFLTIFNQGVREYQVKL